MEMKELVKLLEDEGIDVSLYGKGQAKSLEKLLCEINDPEEETYLAQDSEGRLLRKTTVLNIHVLYQDDNELLRLREIIQIFNDGRFRSRLNRQAAISEKIHEGEGEGDSILRALGEELGCTHVDFDRLMPLTTYFMKKESQSYPGLVTEYKICYFIFHVDDFFFCPEGYVEVQKDKKTYFAWEKV